MSAVDYYRPSLYAIGGSSGGRTPLGNVRLVDRMFADDAGIFNPLGDTLFTIQWMAKHDRAMLERELSLVRGDFVRAWGEVGGSSWSDRIIDPREADYESHLAFALDRVWEYQKRVFLTIFAGGSVGVSDLDLTVDKILNVVRDRRHVLQCIEIANEDNFVGSDDDLRRLARKISSALPGVPLMPYSQATQFQDVCNATNYHLERTDGDKGWRVARQAWGIDNPCAQAQGEPAGIHLHQNEDVHDAVRLAFMWLVGILNAFTLFTIHTGAGVRSGGQADRNLGRPASFADPEMADYPTHAAKCRELAALLPEGVCNWHKTSQRGTSPWSDNFLWSDAVWSDGQDHGVSRNYVAYSGGRFVCLCFGIYRFATMLTSKHVVAEIYDAYSGAVQTVDVPAGGSFRLEGNEETNAAYVINGSYS